MKASIKRENGLWVATRPRLGFGGPEVRTFPTQQSALKWVDGRVGRQGTVASLAERSGSVEYGDPGYGMNVVATPSSGQHHYG